MSNNKPLPVIIRRDDTDRRYRVIVAFFPTLPDTPANGSFTCFTAHEGHGAASFPYYWFTQKSSQKEVEWMLEELRRAGYDNLKVYRRWQQWFDKARQNEIARIKIAAVLPSF